MSRLLSDPTITELPWHDASVDSINASWSKDGIVMVGLRIKLNPEESLQPLIHLGVNTTIIDVQFKQVWRLTTDIRGDSTPKEVLLDWNIIQPSPLIKEIKDRGMAKDVLLRHHQLQFSGGTVMDVVFEQASLEEVF